MYISFPTSKYICNMMYLYIIYIYLCLIYSIYQPMLICYLSTAVYIIISNLFTINNTFTILLQVKRCVCVYIYIYILETCIIYVYL